MCQGGKDQVVLLECETSLSRENRCSSYVGSPANASLSLAICYTAA